VDGALRRELWLGGVESGGRSLSEALQQPSLNIRGLEAAAVGAAARNVIPSLARASADIRLVKGNDPRAMIEKVKAHIRAQGFLLVEGREPSESERMSAPRVARLDAREGGYRAVRTPMDLPASRRVIAAVEAAAGETVRMPTLGGSVPLAYIEDIFAVPLIGVPIVNHDNSQHSHNENLRLANLWSGIEVMAALFTMR
jgi:acetylornithine deacetylase/succinyl-diaminopimelate desuccinylase-like protein